MLVAIGVSVEFEGECCEGISACRSTRRPRRGSVQPFGLEALPAAHEHRIRRGVGVWAAAEPSGEESRRLRRQWLPKSSAMSNDGFDVLGVENGSKRLARGII
jgi:hypothetical protein